MAGKASDTIETFDSLTKKLQEADVELKTLETKLEELLKKKASEKANDENDLDKYMAQLRKGDSGANKEAMSKVKLRMKELSSERERLIKLINIAKPTHMPELKSGKEVSAAKPKQGIMIGKLGSRGMVGKIKSVSKNNFSKPIVVAAERTKVLEAFLQEDEEKSKRLKMSVEGDDDELKPIGYDVQKPTEPVKKQRIGDTSSNKTPAPMERKLGPSMPDHIKSAIDSSNPDDEADKTIEKENLPDDTPQPAVGDVVMDDLDNSDTVKRKRGDRGAKRKNNKPEEQEEVKEDYYKVGMDEKYDVWLPPQNQSGDGKTSLNEKLGY